MPGRIGKEIPRRASSKSSESRGEELLLESVTAFLADGPQRGHREPLMLIITVL